MRLTVQEHYLWLITVDTPTGQQQGSLELHLSNDGCQGRLFNDSGELAIENASVDDDGPSWEVRLAQPIAMTIACHARVNGDTMKGVATVAAFGDINFTGTLVTKGHADL